MVVSEVVVAPVDTADDVLLDGADLLVVGGPTRVHGMSRESTRKAEHGCDLVVEPESFVVTKNNRLLADEEDQAREWGHALARAFAAR